ncbi:MAG: sarcosine oxidase subunit delta [Litoreibacter sp.]|uniref:sarcosine oxidase subunit delta n=1 Tax=Litoreibacter sp. TaxID=1969459 RepID=UPI00329A002C
MRIKCPICGERDRREFYYLGAADYLDRPAEGDLDAIHKYLHIRENPAGVTRELWHHEAGCSSWLVVERNVTTHDILSVELASDLASEVAK